MTDRQTSRHSHKQTGKQKHRQRQLPDAVTPKDKEAGNIKKRKLQDIETNLKKTEDQKT